MIPRIYSYTRLCTRNFCFQSLRNNSSDGRTLLISAKVAYQIGRSVNENFRGQNEIPDFQRLQQQLRMSFSDELY